MQELFILEDLLNVLIELETLAYKHYLDMAEITDDPELTSLFKDLAEKELAHKVFFKGYKSKAISFSTSQLSVEYKGYMDVLLKNAVDFLRKQVTCSNFEEGFELAVKLEKDAIFFLSETKNIIDNEFHPDIEELMNQERQHLRDLLEYKRI